MSGQFPRVSIGMPVYNGERYIEQAIESILAQTFSDFELIISDNASTDRTADICRSYAERDRRIRYCRNETNIGYGRNQNLVIELSSGEYFLCAHHDDVRAPQCLERCIEILEKNPSVVLCYTYTRDIDERGQPLPRTDPPLNLHVLKPRDRFRDIIRMDHICEPDFGLIRSSVLKKTGLHGYYADSDRVFLAELALYGPFHRIPEYLFFRRAHVLQSTAQCSDRQSRTRWYDPSKIGEIVFPHFREFREYLRIIGRVPIPLAEKLHCYASMVKWVLVNRRRLSDDLTVATKDVLRPFVKALVVR